MLKFYVLIVTFSLLLLSNNSPAAPKVELLFCASNWKPFSYLDEEGKAQGIYMDILREVFEKDLEVSIQYQQLPWKRAQYYVESGHCDFNITVKTPERLKYAVSSKNPLLELYLHVYTYKNHPKLEEIRKITSGKDIHDLGLIPVTNSGNIWHEKKIDSYSVKTHYVNNEEIAFKVLANKRADISIEPLYAGTYLINKLKLADMIEPTEARFGPLEFYIIFSKKSPFLDLLRKADEVLARLQQNGRLNEILQAHNTIVQPEN